ncbi:MAG: precorrin-6y C5,15-methyltransferase (decarboxylating) subunit CbiE [Aeoliella sp.]
MQKIAIIGIGDDGLQAVPPGVSERITSAEVLIGTERALARMPASVNCERIPVTGDLAELSAQIQAAGERQTAILMTGDPMFYGLARYLTEEFGKERFEIIPHVSSMQLAFARVMESWDEAYLTNLAHHSLDAVIEKVRTAEKVGLFTSDQVGPNKVAQALVDKRIDYFDAYVCENLGARNERVTKAPVDQIAKQNFEPLNVMILIRKQNAPDQARDEAGRRLFGNPDEVFLQSQPKCGLLTTAEVRSLALAQMDIGPRCVVWDVGAGSGSVSIEAAQLASDGTVYAIEQDPEDHGLIKANAERFEVENVEPVLGTAPEVWADLPDPDSVFIAGAGREVLRIAQAAFSRLRPGGRLVVNLVSIDNLSELRQVMQQKCDTVEVWMASISRGTEQLEQLTFDALKPSFLLAVTK